MSTREVIGCGWKRATLFAPLAASGMKPLEMAVETVYSMGLPGVTRGRGNAAEGADMSSPWVKPGSELVAHLVRPSATNGTAEWLVACRSIENGRWEAYVAYGKSGSRGAMKVLGVCD
ncbi:MAG: hypothetical protein IPO08_24365 [Xanthomonadales bacterium]|nr:hypothetical protein [Xanthomonadales bacterium]